MKEYIINSDGSHSIIERELTCEEIAQQQKEEIDHITNAELSFEDKMALFVNSIPVEYPQERSANSGMSDKLPFKLGYKWEPKYNGTAIIWELVEDPNAIGLESNPIIFAEGMPLLPNAFYLHEDKKYVYVGITGTATTWDEAKDYMEPW